MIKYFFIGRFFFCKREGNGPILPFGFCKPSLKYLFVEAKTYKGAQFHVHSHPSPDVLCLCEKFIKETSAAKIDWLGLFLVLY